MQSGTIYTTDLQSFNNETITLPAGLPMEVGYVIDDSQKIQLQDSVPVVELGKQLLHHAKLGDTEMIRDLMCRGAPFQADPMGTSALHFAAQNNHLETADVLLRAGISRDARTKVERTPLHMAAYEGHDQMAILLLRYGAEVDCRDMLKMTPLHWAIECERDDVIHVLLDHGADPKALSKFDKTPITLAFEHDRLDLVDIMQQERVILKSKPIQHDQLAEFQSPTTVQKLIHAQIERQKLEITQPYNKPYNKKSIEVINKPQVVYQQIYPASISDDNDDNNDIDVDDNDNDNDNDNDDIDIDDDDDDNDDDDDDDHHQDKNSELIDTISNISYEPFDKQKDIEGIKTFENSYELLEAIMVPPENDSSIVENAVASGGKLVMTEAGKRAYKLTGVNQLGVKRLKPVTGQNDIRKKVYTIARADQLLNDTINNLKGPNILKKTMIGNKTSNFVLTSINNSTNVTPLRLTSKKIIKVHPIKEKIPENSQRISEIFDDIDDTNDININDNHTKEITDIGMLNKQLAEARKMAANYREKLKEKEAEAEIYEQQLKKIKTLKKY